MTVCWAFSIVVLVVASLSEAFECPSDAEATTLEERLVG
jgi:hypothetical protein